MKAAEAGRLGALASKNITNWLKKQERIVNYYKNPIVCKYCSRIIEYKKRLGNKFCSRTCAANYNNFVRYSSRKDVEVDKRISISKQDQAIIHYFRRCRRCGKKISIRKEYCSQKCRFDYEIISGINVTALRLRKFLLNQNSRCMNPDCLWDWDKNNNVCLELHHIDGNSENNSLSNVILLCPNCHSLTETYKARNIGKGRAFRRKRYKEGKSY